jgi:hypothetical protein
MFEVLLQHLNYVEELYEELNVPAHVKRQKLFYVEVMVLRI